MTHAATIPVPAAREPLPDIRDKDTGSESVRPGFALKNLNFRKLLTAGAALVVLAGAVNYGWDYWTVGQHLVSTDDAYVKADSTTVAPKVSGYLREVLVGDNERVKAGQVLRSTRPNQMSPRPTPRSPANRPSSRFSRR
jgi:membrane fusion protein, multidrug efflux system